jgi:parallel beta-helix repeat protein
MHYLFIRKTMTFYLVALMGPALAEAASIDVLPGMDIPSIVDAHPKGTTFIIHPGLYRLTKSIRAKNGDSFVGQMACAPPATPCPAILNGARLLTSFRQSGSYHYVTGQTQRGRVTVPSTRCEPDMGYPTAYPGCIYPEDLFVDGQPLVHVIALADLAPGAWFFDYPNDTIYMYDNPAGHTVETSVTASAFVWSSGNNVTIENLTIEEFAVPLQFGAIGISAPSQFLGIDWVIKNNEIRYNHGAGVSVNFGWQVLNNYIHQNGQLGITGGLGSNTVASGILIQGNELAHNNYAHVSPSFGAGGIKISHIASAVFRDNYAHDNEGSGFHGDVASRNIVYDNNTSADNTEQGIFFEISYGAVVRNNKLLRNGYIHPNNSAWLYGADLLSSSSQDVIAYCNIAEVSPQGGNGTNIITQPRGEISQGNHFHHNTVIFGGNSGVSGGASTATRQRQFFLLNQFDNNTYHLPSLTQVAFPWDNKLSDFSKFQEFGQDTQGSIDTKYKSSVPSVAITSPLDGSSFSGPITITGTAHDTTSISKVEFYVDWNLHSTVGGSSPFNIPWSTTGLSAGLHTLTAMAYNAEGIRACYAVDVTVP